jgi:hypothetical protein
MASQVTSECGYIIRDGEDRVVILTATTSVLIIRSCSIGRLRRFIQTWIEVTRSAGHRIPRQYASAIVGAGRQIPRRQS